MYLLNYYTDKRPLRVSDKKTMNAVWSEMTKHDQSELCNQPPPAYLFYLWTIIIMLSTIEGHSIMGYTAQCG